VNCLASTESTLRHWLKQAHMPLSIHPTDARVKCLTHEQVQQLAVLHGRMLKPDEAGLSVSLVETPPPSAQQEPLYPHMISDAALGKIPSAVLLEEGELSQKLSHLQAQVVAQQQQLVLLTQALLQERDRQTQRRLSSLDASAQPMAEPEISRSRSENPTTSLPISQDAGRPLHPAEQRARFLVLPPLIEYGATGTYVVISSQEGEIPLIADSAEWFEWFRTLSSFRFRGKPGHFGACRGYDRRPTRTWYAHRTIHQHEYKHYLGLSEHLTVAHLEEMAAKFQSYVDAL
jgi:hypothetical protein